MKKGKSEESLRNLQDTTEWANIRIKGIGGEEEKEEVEEEEGIQAFQGGVNDFQER